MKSLRFLKSKVGQGLAVVAATGLSVAAHADIAADIAAASTAANTNVDLAITAIVGIAALVMGLGIILSLMKRG